MGIVELVIELPGWVEQAVAGTDGAFTGLEERMSFVIGLAARNVAEKTGGPFGAAVFERDSGRLLAVGVNRVVGGNCSIAHAEMLALAMAQQAVGNYDLGSAGKAACELVSSAEPCAMCLGAIPWSGVRRLVCGARAEDAERVGFDEGDKPDDWVGGLKSRGVTVVRDVLRDQAAAVMQKYREGGGVAYNGRQA